MADFLTSTAVGIETGFDNEFKLDRKSGTLATNFVESKDYGKLNFKGIFNTDKKSQLRFAAVSAPLTMSLGGMTLSTSLEDKVTVKTDKFDTTDVINSTRVNLGAKYDRTKTSLYYSQKFEYSMYNKDFAHKITTGINQELGSSGVSLYGEAYLLPESFKGDFSKACYALGISAKLP